MCRRPVQVHVQRYCQDGLLQLYRQVIQQMHDAFVLFVADDEAGVSVEDGDYSPEELIDGEGDMINLMKGKSAASHHL